jgi:two-component system response regulator HydG
MRSGRVLIIDDDPSFLVMIKTFLEKRNFTSRGAKTAFDGLKILTKEQFDIIILDFKLPDKNGIEVLKEIRKMAITTPVILMTSYIDIKTAVNAIKLGAFDYVTKPVNNDEIFLTIKKAIEQKSGKPVAAEPKKQSQASGFEYIYGKSTEAERLRQYIDLVAPTSMSVIIQGESGTGKEFVARMIHLNSARKDKPFVAIDCGALTKDLAGSELFGHIKGSFTGAFQDKSGQFEEANLGTLFLDEIGNLSYEIQVKLLRALQERKIRRIGDNKDIEVDVRIIVATNEDLANAVKNGNFREDLFHRLNEFGINVAPLRNRDADLMIFADHFLTNANRELGKKVEGFAPDVMEKFRQYNWPGNLRELKNLIKRAVLLAHQPVVTMDSIPPEITNYEAEMEEFRLEANNTSDLKAIAEKNEREIIINTLKSVGYNKSKAARLMNIDRKTLYNKLKLYGLEY